MKIEDEIVRDLCAQIAHEREVERTHGLTPRGQWSRFAVVFGVGFYCWSSASTGSVDWRTPAIMFAALCFGSGAALLARVGIVVAGPAVRRRSERLRRWFRRHFPHLPTLFH